MGEDGGLIAGHARVLAREIPQCWLTGQAAGAVAALAATQGCAPRADVHTDWVMRCTPRKVLRTAERDPVVLPPAKRAA